VLTLVIAAAPAVLNACSLVCAGGDLHRSHSCHEAQPAGTTSVTSGTHVCGHGDGLPDASGTLTPESAPAPMLAAAVLPQPVHVQGAPVRLATVALLLPDPLKLKTQLRI